MLCECWEPNGVVCKSSQCSESLSHLSSLFSICFKSCLLLLKNSSTAASALSDCQQPRTSQKQSHSPRVPTGVPSDSGPPPKVTLKLMFALPAFLSLRNVVVQLAQNLGCDQGSFLCVCFQVAAGRPCFLWAVATWASV